MSRNGTSLFFCCNEENDLYQVVTQSGYRCLRDNNLLSLLEKAPDRAGVLVLADDYPRQTVNITKEILDIAGKKSLRMYLEYPQTLAGIPLGDPKNINYERLVVSSEFFGSKLRENTIMMLNNCWYLPVENVASHLCMAKVAGYDRAVFGIGAKRIPILFPYHNNENILVSTSSLSRFIIARYAPYTSWKCLWEHLLNYLTCGEFKENLVWQLTVGPTYTKQQTLPDDIEQKAMRRSFAWFRNHVIYSAGWKKAAIEGFESNVDYLGRQFIKNITRGDCVAESGMVLGFHWYLDKDPDKKYLSEAIFDYLWTSPEFVQNDPESSMYGLSNWFINTPIFYGDDNARVIMASLLASSLLGEERWHEAILRCLLANLRTTNKLGFRPNRLEYKSFGPKNMNWVDYQNDNEYTSYAPHYEAYLWAAYLWAYSLTGYADFLVKARNAISMCMAQYPNGWTWTNSLTDEMSHMLLPLAWLIRVDDTKEHRSWLYQIAEDLLEYMDESGAIQDMFGDLRNGKYPPPQSNEDYGKTEASLIQNNGDPATDLLYTTNWAFLGLHEAAAVTGDKVFIDAENKLAEFLCRIQVTSKEQTYLEGAWMRSFDFQKWEYWGSSADVGWGAWCVESGWTNSWIASVLALRQMGCSMFELVDASKFKPLIAKLVKEMFAS